MFRTAPIACDPARRATNCRAAAPAAREGAPSRQPGRSPYNGFAFFACALLLAFGATAQEPAPGTVQITFLPPPLEHAAYSVGIYEANSRRLIRRLCEYAPEGAFTAGLNGLITHWDRRDDEGRLAPPGRYAARGYAVGPLKVEGVAFRGNDWAAADENLRVKHVESIRLAPDGKGLIAAVTLAGGAVSDLTLSPDGDLLSRQPAAPVSPGKESPAWTADADAGFIQRAPDGTVLRRLATAPGDPLPRAIVASAAEDRIYLLEEKDGWQRLRALSWVDAKQEDGQPVSTWQTVFERNIRRPELPPAAPAVEVALEENPLSPGKPSHAHLTAGFDPAGSYLQTADGLRLRRISDRLGLSAARLVRGAKGLTFLQFDGAAWDEFSISGTSAMMTFDAGDFDVTGAGEKPAQKPTEPPDR